MSDKMIKQFENEMKDFQDRLEILETRMNRLEKIPQELETLKKSLDEVLGVFFSGLDIDSCIRDFVFIAERSSVDAAKTLAGTFLKSMKDFFETYSQSTWKALVSKYMKRWGSIIVFVISSKRIGFNDFRSIAVENLGNDVVKKTFALEDIVRCYGAKNAATWKRLTK